MSVVTTGTVVLTAKLWSSVSVSISGRTENMMVNQLQFYSFNVQCAEDMTNLLEEGMTVQLCYKEVPNRGTRVQCAWIGDPPDCLGIKRPPNPVYNQQGVLSEIWEDGLVIDSHLGKVLVKHESFFWDGRRDTVCSTALVEVWFDAIPLKDPANSTAKYVATCCWIGRRPTVVERAWPKLKETFELTYTCSNVAGTVGLIISEAMAIADAKAFSRCIKVLVLRRSFGQACDRLQDVVNVGDNLLMRIKHCCLFQGCRLWYAEKACSGDDVSLDNAFEAAVLTEVFEDNERALTSDDAGTVFTELQGLICPETHKTRGSVVGSCWRAPRLAVVETRTACGEPQGLICPGTHKTRRKVVGSCWGTPRLAAVETRTACGKPQGLICPGTHKTRRNVIGSCWGTPRLAAVEKRTACGGPQDFISPWTCETGESSFVASSSGTSSLAAVETSTTCVEPDPNCNGTIKIGGVDSSLKTGIPTVGDAEGTCVEPAVLDFPGTLNARESASDRALETPRREAIGGGTTGFQPLDLSYPKTQRTGESVDSGLGAPKPAAAFKAGTCYKPIDLSSHGTRKTAEKVNSCFETSKWQTVVTSSAEKTVLNCRESLAGRNGANSRLETPTPVTTCVEPAVVNGLDSGRGAPNSDFEIDPVKTLCVKSVDLFFPGTVGATENNGDSALETPSLESVGTVPPCVEPIVVSDTKTLDTGKSVDSSDFESLIVKTEPFGVCVKNEDLFCMETAENAIDSDFETPLFMTVKAETTCVEPAVVNDLETLDSEKRVTDCDFETGPFETLGVENADLFCPVAVETAENVGDSTLETPKLETVETKPVECMVVSGTETPDIGTSSANFDTETLRLETDPIDTSCVKNKDLFCPSTTGTADGSCSETVKVVAEPIDSVVPNSCGTFDTENSSPYFETQSCDSKGAETLSVSEDLISSGGFVADEVGEIPDPLYRIPPLTGIMSRFMAHASITFNKCKIFLDRSNLFVDTKPSGDFLDSVLGSSGKAIIKFDAVRTERVPGFTHEATLAWLGEKPDLFTIAPLLPAPKFELLKDPKQRFFGIVRKLLLPYFALIEIPALWAVVVASSSNFAKDTSKGPSQIIRCISDCVGLNDCVQFLVRRRLCPPMLCACNIVRVQCSEAEIDAVRTGRLWEAKNNRKRKRKSS